MFGFVFSVQWRTEMDLLSFVDNIYLRDRTKAVSVHHPRGGPFHGLEAHVYLETESFPDWYRLKDTGSPEAGFLSTTKKRMCTWKDSTFPVSRAMFGFVSSAWWRTEMDLLSFVDDSDLREWTKAV